MDTTKRKGIDRLCPKGLLILLFMLPAGLWAQDAGVAATTAAPDATAGALGELATGLNTVWMLLAAMLVFCNLQIFLCLFLEKLNMPQNTPVTKAS